MKRLQVHHNKENDTVFVSWYEDKVSGTLELTAEEAEAIGAVGTMAKLSKEQKNAGQS